MPEDLSRDPLVHKLARFTPTSAAIDRDAMLFAAGRASAPGPVKWKLLAGLFGLTQLVTIAFLVTTSGAGGFREHIDAIATSPPSPQTSGEGEALPSLSYLDLMNHWRSGDLPRPEAISDNTPPLPDLSIASSRKALDLN